MMMLIVFFVFIGGYFTGSCVAGALHALDRGKVNAANKPGTRFDFFRDAHLNPDGAD